MAAVDWARAAGNHALQGISVVGEMRDSNRSTGRASKQHHLGVDQALVYGREEHHARDSYPS